LSRGRLRREIAAFSQRTDPHPDDVGSLDAAHSDSPGELIGHRNDAECQVPKKKTSVGSDNIRVLLLEAGGCDDRPEIMEANQWPFNLGSDRDWGFHAQTVSRRQRSLGSLAIDG
jgi:hypothetical protein